ncbi:MAG: hypothetical protein ACHRXM_18200 [Isosphaerales bacterium]
MTMLKARPGGCRSALAWRSSLGGDILGTALVQECDPVRARGSAND